MKLINNAKIGYKPEPKENISECCSLTDVNSHEEQNRTEQNRTHYYAL